MNLTKIIATAALVVAGLSIPLAASASTTCHTVTHTIYKTERVVRHHKVSYIRVKVIHKTTTCTATGPTGPQGATGPQGSTGPAGTPAPVVTLTPRQIVQAWADATGNADYRQVELATNQLGSDTQNTPGECADNSCNTYTYDQPSAALQAKIKADANALVTDAQAALADPAPGDFATAWSTVMSDQVTYGQQIAADPANWFLYTFSQADANLVNPVAASNDLVYFMVEGALYAPTVGVAVTAAELYADAVSTWAYDGGAGNAAANGFQSLPSPLVRPYWTWFITDAQAALADPPPGVLAAPFIAVANDYLIIGSHSSNSGNDTVTPAMVATLNSDITAWNAALAANPDVTGLVYGLHALSLST